MNGKTLAKILLEKYPEHEIVIQEYKGCNHSIFSASSLIPTTKGEKPKNWDREGDSNFNTKKGTAKRDILLIK